MTIRKSWGSRTRLLLLLLLLVAGGGGFYYFQAMEEEPPPPPAKKVVASAPKPVTTPVAAPVASTPPAGPVTAGQMPASITPPLAEPAPAPGGPSVSVAPPPKSMPPSSSPSPETPVSAVVPSAPRPSTPATTPAGAAPPSPKSVTVAVPPPPKSMTEAVAAPVIKPHSPVPTSGLWRVEAGTYLNATALKAAEKKIRTLGYEPQISTTKKSIHMIRLRIGTVAEDHLKDALGKARAIIPEAFALRSGDAFAVYAGTFADQQNLLKMREYLTSQGFKVQEEPVDLVRTISLLRFGGFKDQASADEAANRARHAGIAAEVVSPR